MARLSKADWNKLKKSVANVNGLLLTGVKWRSGRGRGRPKKWQGGQMEAELKLEGGGNVRKR